MSQYEYMTNRVPIDISLEHELNLLGSEGWQVVNVERFRHFTDILLMRKIPLAVSDLGVSQSRVKHNHSIKVSCWTSCPLRGTVQEIV